MTKIVIFIALVCVTIASAARFGLNRKVNFYRQQVNGSQWSLKLCENTTLAQSFLTRLLAFITTLETNGSFTAVLEDHAHTVAYFKDTANAALLSSNCTDFFVGLRNAQKLDKQAEQQQEKYAEIVDVLYKRILQSLLGFRSFIDGGF